MRDELVGMWEFNDKIDITFLFELFNYVPSEGKSGWLIFNNVLWSKINVPFSSPNLKIFSISRGGKDGEMLFSWSTDRKDMYSYNFHGFGRVDEGIHTGLSTVPDNDWNIIEKQPWTKDNNKIYFYSPLQSMLLENIQTKEQKPLTKEQQQNFMTWLKANAKKIPLKKISFKINGKTYEAINYTHFSVWLNSDYNVDNITIPKGYELRDKDGVILYQLQNIYPWYIKENESFTIAPPPPMVNFKINSVENNHKAEKGNTWRQWCNDVNYSYFYQIIGNEIYDIDKIGKIVGQTADDTIAQDGDYKSIDTSNLVGTTWVFNEKLTDFTYYANITFKSNNVEYSSMQININNTSETKTNKIEYNKNDNGTFSTQIAYDTTWKNTAYRTIKIIDTQNLSNYNSSGVNTGNRDRFIAWLKANAVKQ